MDSEDSITRAVAPRKTDCNPPTPRRAFIDALAFADNRSASFRKTIKPFILLALTRRNKALSLFGPAVEIVDALTYVLAMADTRALARFHAVAKDVLDDIDLEEFQRHNLLRQPSKRNERLEGVEEMLTQAVEEMIEDNEPEETIAQDCAGFIGFLVGTKTDSMTEDQRTAAILKEFRRVDREMDDSEGEALLAHARRPKAEGSRQHLQDAHPDLTARFEDLAGRKVRAALMRLGAAPKGLSAGRTARRVAEAALVGGLGAFDLAADTLDRQEVAAALAKTLFPKHARYLEVQPKDLEETIAAILTTPDIGATSLKWIASRVIQAVWMRDGKVLKRVRRASRRQSTH